MHFRQMIEIILPVSVSLPIRAVPVTKSMKKRGATWHTAHAHCSKDSGTHGEIKAVCIHGSSGSHGVPPTASHRWTVHTSVFAWLTAVTNTLMQRQTGRHTVTDHASPSVAIACIYTVLLRMRGGLKTTTKRTKKSEIDTGENLTSKSCSCCDNYCERCTCI